MTIWLGIDFGTCFSSAALMLNGNLERIKNPRKLGYSFPSSVYVPGQGDILVGNTADNQRNKDPERYRREFKRDLGRSIPYQFGDRQFLPEDLVTEVLRKLKQEAEVMVKAHGYEALNAAVITVPTTYQDHKRNLMEQAAQQAGFTEVELLEEPVATALYYTQYDNIEAGEIILVYDLGGGTFDATLMQKQAESYNLLAQPVGLEHCGGIDFDQEIFSDLKEKTQETQLGALLDPQRRDPEALRARLMIADWCREAKHQLSEVKIFEDLPPGFYSDFYTLSREQFNTKIQSYIEKTVSLCEQLLKDADLSWEKINKILLVGGSCRVPIVQQALTAKLEQAIVLADEPELAVCLGAAIRGDALEQEKKADIFIARGLTHFAQQNNVEALAQYKQALAINPNSALAYFSCGLSHYRIQQYQEAVASYSQSLALNNDFSLSYFCRGLTYIEVGNSEGAISDFRQAGILPDVTDQNDDNESRKDKGAATPYTDSLSEFSFEVLTVNETSTIIKRDQKKASHFIEDVGNGIEIDMVSIPAGKFIMGSSKTEPGHENCESPDHEVILQPFCISRFPITQSQWRAVAESQKIRRDLRLDPSRFKGENLPVEQVSWHDASEFCERLSRLTNRTYCLPSEAQWEYACRACTRTAFHLGPTLNFDIVNFDGSNGSGNDSRYRQQTTPVGSLNNANNFSLMDMHGNVRELCLDLWHKNYQDAPSDGKAWLNFGELDTCVVRGGSWMCYGHRCRSARREKVSLSTRFSDMGFRVVLF